MTNIDDLITQLTHALAARKTPIDLPRTLTMRQVAEYVEATRAMARTITLLRNLPHDIARQESQLADLEARDARITELRARIASLRSGLDAHLKQAEQLLAAPVTQ